MEGVASLPLYLTILLDMKQALIKDIGIINHFREKALNIKPYKTYGPS